jgi:hypothetical protein
MEAQSYANASGNAAAAACDAMSAKLKMLSTNAAAAAAAAAHRKPVWSNPSNTEPKICLCTSPNRNPAQTRDVAAAT